MTPPPLLAGAVRFRQAEQVGQHVQHPGLDLGAGGARRPEHALNAQARGQQLAQDGGSRSVAGEVGVEAGRLPVRQAGEDPLRGVPQDLVEGFALGGHLGVQGVGDLARTHARQDGIALDVLVIVGDPVDHFPAVSAEVLRRHVVALLLGHAGASLGFVRRRPTGVDTPR